MSQYGYGGNVITETTVKQAGALTQLEPSMESLSEKQILAILEKGKPAFRERILKSGIAEFAKKYPGLKSSGQYWSLVQFGLNHAAPNMRIKAATLLKGESGPEALKMKALALKDEYFVVRLAAAESLQNESGPEALKLKAQALNDQDRDVRGHVAASLRNESGPEAERLRQLALRDPDSYVRAIASKLQIPGAGASDSAATDAVVSIQRVSDTLFPPADPLCQGCLPSSGPKPLEEASLEELARKMAGKTPEQMRRTPGFQSACQRHFGAFF
jgi:hypothetical protein